MNRRNVAAPFVQRSNNRAAAGVPVSPTRSLCRTGNWTRGSRIRKSSCTSTSSGDDGGGKVKMLLPRDGKQRPIATSFDGKTAKTATPFKSTTEPTFCFYWNRPLGAPAGTFRLSVESTRTTRSRTRGEGGRQQQRRTPSARCHWALPILSREQLISAVRRDLGRLEREGGSEESSCFSVELAGNDEAWEEDLPRADWEEILRRGLFPLQSRRCCSLRSVKFLLSVPDEHAAMLLERSRDTLERVAFLQFPSTTTTTTCAQSGSRRTLKELSKCQSLTELRISSAAVLDDADCSQMAEVLRGLPRLSTFDGRFKVISLLGWTTLFERLEDSATLEEIHFLPYQEACCCSSSKPDERQQSSTDSSSDQDEVDASADESTNDCEKNSRDCTSGAGSISEQLVSYLAWIARANRTKRLLCEKANPLLADTRYPPSSSFGRSRGQREDARRKNVLARIASTRERQLEAATVVLKDWYRTSHRPVLPNLQDGLS